MAADAVKELLRREDHRKREVLRAYIEGRLQPEQMTTEDKMFIRAAMQAELRRRRRDPE